MALCPRTPTKKRPSVIVESPYFSPARKEKRRNVRNEERSTEDDQENDSEKSLDDSSLPATFSSLYQRLEQLKPTLIQESVSDDPWKVLVAVTLLNKTTAKVALPMFRYLMEKWGSPWAMSKANEEELSQLLKPCGTYNMRSRRLIDLSKAYIRDPPKASDLRTSKHTMPRSPGSPAGGRRERYPLTPISHLPGTGPYALDSYRIFCTAHSRPEDEDEWKRVMPSDKELIRYLKWKWAYKERKVWKPTTGVFGPVNLAYLKELVSELEQAR